MADSGARSDTRSRLEKILHFSREISSRQIHQEEQLLLEVFKKLSHISNRSFTVESNSKVFLDQQLSILQDYK